MMCLANPESPSHFGNTDNIYCTLNFMAGYLLENWAGMLILLATV